MQPYRAINLALIDWYHQHHRDLPWRRTHDPYAIWLSEVMLQQTQVITVLPYYERFLAHYPDVTSLATAPLDDVLKLWEGLGYYSRCRNLHKAAQTIADHYQGSFPSTLDGINALPGVGRSTAGAIMTFAYGQPHPILDGNVKRVLSRLFVVFGTDTQWLNQLWQHAAQLVDHSPDGYTLNQALMELGATHCSRTQPACLLCPLQTTCQARAQGLTDALPEKTVRKPVPHFNIAGAVIWQHNLIYIQQRPLNGLLGGLWEFPGGKQEAEETLPDTARREVLEETGMAITLKNALPTVRHAYSHFKITLQLYHADWQKGKPTTSQPYLWVKPSQLSDYAFPKANKVIVDYLIQTFSNPVV
jgi:A/G-specific adenine glycosylase